MADTTVSVGVELENIGRTIQGLRQVSSNMQRLATEAEIISNRAGKSSAALRRFGQTNRTVRTLADSLENARTRMQMLARQADILGQNRGKIQATANSLKAFERALANPNVSIQQLNQKFRRFNQVLGENQRRLAQESGLLDRVTNSTTRYGQIITGLQRPLTRAEQASRKASRTTSKFRGEMVELTKAVQIALGPLSGVAARITAFSALTSSASINLATMTAAIIGIGGAAFALARMAKEFDQVGKRAQRLNIPVEEFQRLEFAASQAGVETADFERAMERLAKSAGQALRESEDSVRSFNRLGISIRDLRRLDTAELFFEIAEALEGSTESFEDFAAVTQIFGRSAAGTINLLRQGPEAIRATGDEAERLGLILEASLIRESREVTDELDKLGRVLKLNLFRVLSAGLPVLRNASAALTEFGAAAKDNTLAIQTILGILTGAAIGRVGGGLGALIGGGLGGSLAIILSNLDETLDVIRRIRKAAESVSSPFQTIADVISLIVKLMAEFFLLATRVFVFVGQIAAEFAGAKETAEEFAAAQQTISDLTDKIGDAAADLTLFGFLGDLPDTLKGLEAVLEGIRRIATGIGAMGGFPGGSANKAVEEQLAESRRNLAEQEILLFRTQGRVSGLTDEFANFVAQQELVNKGFIEFDKTADGSIRIVNIINKELQELNKVMAATAARQDFIQFFEDTRTPLENFSAQLRQLNQIAENVPDSQEVINRRMAQMREELIAATPLLTELESNLGDVGDKLFDLAQGAEDAAEKLRATFKSLVDDLIKEILRLAVINPVINTLLHGDPNTGRQTISGVIGNIQALATGTPPSQIVNRRGAAIGQGQRTPGNLTPIQGAGFANFFGATAQAAQASTRAAQQQTQAANQASNSASSMGQAFSNLTTNLGDALGSFFTGIGDLLTSAFDFLTNLLNKFVNSVSNLISGASGGGGGGGILSFLGLAGGGGGNAATSAGANAFIGNLTQAGGTFGFGFQHGGSFKVGGVGGSDSQLVGFRASPSETVHVTKPGQRVGGGNTFFIDARGADKAALMRVERQIRQLDGSIERRSVTAVQKARKDNPRLFNSRIV